MFTWAVLDPPDRTVTASDDRFESRSTARLSICGNGSMLDHEWSTRQPRITLPGRTSSSFGIGYLATTRSPMRSNENVDERFLLLIRLSEYGKTPR